MQEFYLPDAVRAAEADAARKLPPGTLMARAAFAVAEVVLAELRERHGSVLGRRVLLLVGSGDNGGDALFAGALLRARGVAVDAIGFGASHRGGAAAFERSGGRLRRYDAAPGFLGDLLAPDLIVDGIVGISGRPGLRAEPRAVLDAFGSAPIVAIDLPSGWDPITGAAGEGALTAAVTVVPGVRKPVHALAPGACGRIVDVQIGLTLANPVGMSLEHGDVVAGWPVPGGRDDKYSLGVVGIIAGSDRYPGAAVLAVSGAVAATPSMVRYIGEDPSAVLARFPEVIAHPALKHAGTVQAWVVGPGLGVSRSTKSLRWLRDRPEPIVVDADAITALAADPGLLAGRTAATLLTPHAGEFARLAAATGSRTQREVAESFGATVLLKGATTRIIGPASAPGGGRWAAQTAPHSWAATPGSGDVLSGIIGALLAAGTDPGWAAAAATYVHGRAARPGGASRIAAGVADFVESLTPRLR